MKHLIMGTAGHIDHGKTSLVKALTGIDCDTHPEEKRRGITINLGFAHLSLPSGDTIGIIDVPGHRDFVHTMVSGASGIDFCCMVIAANEGIMPQTTEHLRIMQVLGIRSGCIALTKADLVEPDVLALAKEEIADCVKGSFLQNAEIIPVSAITGIGIEDLRAAIGRCAASAAVRPSAEVFRLFIDRVFVKSGFGTVVTGSVLSGMLRTGATAFLLPPAQQLRVRRLERHGAEVSEIVAGDRASLNLVGLDKSDFARGMIIADRPLHATSLLDCRLRLFEQSHRFGIWGQAVFLLGTYEAQVRFHILDKNTLGPGDSGLVQIHLPQPCVAVAGDAFVLRSSSSDITLGGGDVIDAAPLRHRRRPSKLVEGLARIAHGDLADLVAMEVGKHRGPIPLREIAEALNVAAADVASAIGSGQAKGVSAYETQGDRFLVTADREQHLIDAIVKQLEAFHRRHPLSPGGRTSEELLGILGLGADGERGLTLVLGQCVKDKLLKQVGRTWALVSHSVKVDAGFEKKIELVDSFLRNCGMQTPLASDIEAMALKSGIDAKTLVQILQHLVAQGKAHSIDGSYVHAHIVDPARRALLGALVQHPGGLTVAAFRDLISANRKICLLLYALFDREGITERQGDVRIMTEKGRNVLQGFTS